MLQLSNRKDLPDNVAVINATDLSPIIENTQIKEIREVLAPATDPKTSRPVEISMKVAELSTTSNIEVSILPLATITYRFLLVFEPRSSSDINLANLFNVQILTVALPEF